MDFRKISLRYEMKWPIGKLKQLWYYENVILLDPKFVFLYSYIYRKLLKKKNHCFSLKINMDGQAAGLNVLTWAFMFSDQWNTFCLISGTIRKKYMISQWIPHYSYVKELSEN